MPVSVAYSEADDALILGLCWAYDYERTSVLTPEQLAEFTGRPRSTLYQHLQLLREMHWIRVDHVGLRKDVGDKNLQVHQRGYVGLV